ncbi:MAG TPA: pyridoxal-phosphate dependent enzyme [Gemmatimonadales bacterium]|nr:pyridoxal-phosphate dependent enzyme [Gemmatimonadales bacterium]
MLPLPQLIPLDAIRAAQAQIFDSAIRTPLIRLPLDGTPEIWLKLETLQPVGSFKIRGARNALGELAPEALAEGVYTASAGNMALGLAWCAKARGIPFTAVVPDHAPAAKLSKLAQLGARLVKVSYDTWWRIIREHRYAGVSGRFIHPVADVAVMAGNGTIGLEILEELPRVDTVLVPFGGGGLSCGIASAISGMGSTARVIGCEVETAMPLSAAFAAGSPQVIERRPSFVDGIGGAGVLPEMWPLIQRLIKGVAVASLEETRTAIRTLVERVHIVAEGAGAVPVAAALSGRVTGKVVCCVVSGGNIDSAVIVEILREQ